MDLKILFLFVLYSVTFYCSADESDYRQVEACAVQYLKQKKMLNESIQATIPASPRCRLLVPFVLQTDKSFQKNIYSRRYKQKGVECFIDKYDKAGGSDYSIKALFLKYTTLLSMDILIEESKLIDNHLDDMHSSTFDQCVTKDVENDYETLWAVSKYEYCIAKYAIDNQLLELKDVDINPNRIDPGSFNCTRIIDAERSETENDYRVSVMECDKESLDCAMDEFRRYNMFGWRVALKALGLFVSGRKAEISKVGVKINEFLSASTSGC